VIIAASGGTQQSPRFNLPCTSRACSLKVLPDWKRQRNTLYVADKQALATVDAKIKPELLG
jgi:hypothetical protein